MCKRGERAQSYRGRDQSCHRIWLDSKKRRQQIVQAWARAIPLKQMANPREIADLVVFLASERASYITGTVIRGRRLDLGNPLGIRKPRQFRVILPFADELKIGTIESTVVYVPRSMVQILSPAPRDQISRVTWSHRQTTRTTRKRK